MNIHTIDLHFMGRPQVIAAFLIENNGERALIETGPSTCHASLLKGLREQGVEPRDISKVLLTHIHLDHAGAAGWWAKQGSQVFVHERGARHLVDPSRLIAGATAVYGEKMDELWGEIPPAPEDQVTAVGEGDRIEIGGEPLKVWDTPGHARHHVAFIGEGVGFVGDDAGVRLPGHQYLSPTTAPSQFEPEPYGATIERLRDARLDAIYLTHFGGFQDVEDHLVRYAQLIPAAAEFVRERLERGKGTEEILPEFTAWNRKRFREEEGEDPDLQNFYETANPLQMCCEGIVQYWEKQTR